MSTGNIDGDGRSKSGIKRFFFEKKNQKTFGPAGCGNPVATARRNQSFLLLFVHKKKCLCRTAEKLPHHPKSWIPACAGMTVWGG
jgi:hypothetical protein